MKPLRPACPPILERRRILRGHAQRQPAKGHVLVNPENLHH